MHNMCSKENPSQLWSVGKLHHYMNKQIDSRDEHNTYKLS
jgi:hypothetical protein